MACILDNSGVLMLKFLSVIFCYGYVEEYLVLRSQEKVWLKCYNERERAQKGK